MKKVKQISLDILVDDNVDGVNLADEVVRMLGNMQFDIVAYVFNEDLTEDYMEYRPDIFVENDKE